MELETSLESSSLSYRKLSRGILSLIIVLEVSLLVMLSSGEAEKNLSKLLIKKEL